MELILTRQSVTQVLVTCDNESSHIFDLRALLPNNDKGTTQPLDDPVSYGRAVYAALFPPETPAQHSLASTPDRILLVTSDNDLDAVPWEYAYGTYGSEVSEDFLVLDCHFGRALPADQRIAPPTLDNGLHIVAVPSNPLDKDIPALNIDGEWVRLQEIVQDVPYAITLERTRPPTIERMRALLANQRHRVVHFMGHGGQQKDLGAFLCFEKDNGDLDPVTARQLVQRVRGTVFLVTLNACVSATPGPTPFSNLAAALVQHKVPYALGMRFSIYDDDARAFSRAFYSELARGTPVEEAVFQARLALVSSSHPGVVGVPVLYTALKMPATGFATVEGTPIIEEHQPRIEVTVLPRAEGAFQGRIDELKQLGEVLTSDSRSPLVTIHGGGGQGKTALARETVERFAYAWPGGVWATTLENLPSREVFVSDLAHFLGVALQEVADPVEMERRVLARLAGHRTLIVLDNAETLVEAVEVNNEGAIRLAQFIRERLPRPPVSLLATSRSYLGWSNEIGWDLAGLAPKEGTELFLQHAPGKAKGIDRALAWELSQKVEGHPLSLRLLSSAFNASDLALSAFVDEYEAQLSSAVNKYAGADHRHRTLYASIDTSVRYLDTTLRSLLSGLWIFHAPFLPETASTIFDPQAKDTESDHSPVYDHLAVLWQRGLLTRQVAPLRDGPVLLYHLQPTMRPYTEQHLEQVHERKDLVAQFGATYADLVHFLEEELDRSAGAVYIAQQAREDIERGIDCVAGLKQGYFLLHWGKVLRQLGDTHRGLALTERALENAQGEDRQLEIQALNSMALICVALGQLQEALTFCEKTVPMTREIGDRVGEAFALSSMAVVFQRTGHPQEALAKCEQALSIVHEIKSRENRGIILSSMAQVYMGTGKLQQSLDLYEQALAILREVGNRLAEAGTLDDMAWVYQRKGQPQRALDLYEQALPVFRELGDQKNEANTLGNMAVLQGDTGQPQQALKLFEQALSLKREVGDRAGEATTLDTMAKVYQDTGQPQQALKLYEQALSLTREVGERPKEATTLNNMAEVYRTAGQPQRALASYEQALSILRDAEDQAGEAATLNNIALVYQTFGQVQQALEYSEQALSISRATGERGNEAIALDNMGVVYHNTGQSQQALVLQEQALQILREVGNRAGEATALSNIDGINFAIGRSEQALTLYEQALSLTREVGNRAGEATVLNNMAIVYQKTEQLKQALDIYEQALHIFREVGERPNEAITLNNMAEVYRAMGQSQQALDLYEQALPILHELGKRSDEVAMLNKMAEIYQNDGHLQQAVVRFEQAYSIAREESDLEGKEVLLTNMGKVYRDMGQPQQALSLYEQALSIAREIGNRVSETTMLNNMGRAYEQMGQLQRALSLYEQAMSIAREIGNQTGEANALINMACVHKETGQSQQALALYEQALPIKQVIGDQEGEADTLAFMADVYTSIGQSQQALSLYEQALSLQQKMSNWIDEVTTLISMARIYNNLAKPQQAQVLYEQGLLLQQKLGNRDGEANIFAEMAAMYADMGQPQQALALYEKGQSIAHEVGNQVEEAKMLANMADVYVEMRQAQQALALDEQALSLLQKVGDRANEVAILTSIAVLQYQHLDLPEEAIKKMEQALAVLTETGLSQGAAGLTSDTLRRLLTIMHSGASLDTPNSSSATVPASQIQLVIDNTIAAMTEMPDHHGAWRHAVLESLQRVQQQGLKWRSVRDFFTAVLAILDGQTFTLPAEHPYAQAVEEILKGIAAAPEPTSGGKFSVSLYQQALATKHLEGDLAGEAAILINMAERYKDEMRQREALELYERALSIQRRIGDRVGQAATLTSIADVHYMTWQPQQALAFYERALPILRSIRDRERVAAILNNMAVIYKGMGKPQRALKLLEQALKIVRKLGYRKYEAATLNNMAEIYRAAGKLERALVLYEQALPIVREVSNRTGEATTLNNLALVYRARGKSEQALVFYEQALSILREVRDKAGEANTLTNMAVAYDHLDRSQEAIKHQEQALAVLIEANLPKDASGRSLEELRHILQSMQTGTALTSSIIDPATLSADDIEQIINSTVAVITIAEHQRSEWRKAMAETLLETQQRGAAWQSEVDFFIAVLAILDGQTPTLPEDHLYIEAVRAIQDGITSYL